MKYPAIERAAAIASLDAALAAGESATPSDASNLAVLFKSWLKTSHKARTSTFMRTHGEEIYEALAHRAARKGTAEK